MEYYCESDLHYSKFIFLAKTQRKFIIRIAHFFCLLSIAYCFCPAPCPLHPAIFANGLFPPPQPSPIAC